MKQLETNNYIFNYNENSCAQEDIEEIANIQETCLEYISHILRLHPNFKIEYYLCDSAKQVGEIYGDNEPCNGFCDLPNKIYAVYNEDIKCIGFHEDAHIISYLINRPESVFIREGLAMFFDKLWRGIDNKHIVSYLMKNNNFISVDKLIDDEIFYKYNCAITYPIAGSFTEWLIYTFGIDKYLSFYSLKVDIKKAFKEIYLMDIAKLSQEYYKFISIFKNDNTLDNRIEFLYKDILFCYK